MNHSTISSLVIFTILGPLSALGSPHAAKRFIGLVIGVRGKDRGSRITHRSHEHRGRGGGWRRSLIKVLYCFHQNNDGSKCEVAHRSLPIRPSKSRADRSQGGVHGTETRTSWARVCLGDAHVCLRDSSCGGGHPSDHGGPQFGSAELVTDLPLPTFAFVLRAPTCASICSHSVCWVWCSQPRSYW